MMTELSTNSGLKWRNILYGKMAILKLNRVIIYKDYDNGSFQKMLSLQLNQQVCNVVGLNDFMVVAHLTGN